MKKKRYVRPDQAADILECSKRTIYRLIREGNLLAFSLRDGGSVRIYQESIDRFAEKRTEKYQYDHGIVPAVDS